MPLREFTCLDCGERTEMLIRSNEDAPISCPKCGSNQLQLELSLFGGYSIQGNNSASVRPRQAGSFKK